jgi:hypothetical protein
VRDDLRPMRTPNAFLGTTRRRMCPASSRRRVVISMLARLATSQPSRRVSVLPSIAFSASIFFAAMSVDTARRAYPEDAYPHFETK